MILYTSLLPTGGLTVSQNLIIINKRYELDFALLAHECCHQEQMRRVGTWTFWFRYITDKSFRKQAEVEAYKLQISKGASIVNCASYLSQNYLLGMTYEDAYKLLR